MIAVLVAFGLSACTVKNKGTSTRARKGIPDTAVAQALHVDVRQLKTIRVELSMSNTDLMELSKRTPREIARVLHHEDQESARAAFARLQATNSDGHIPASALYQPQSPQLFLGFRAQSGAAARQAPTLAPNPQAQAHALDDTANHNGWRSLGPNAIGGRTRAILVDPRNSDVIWLGSVSGGLWRSTDGGREFYPADDAMLSLAVSTLAMAPKYPDTIYAGTGEGFPYADPTVGAGVFRTVDGMLWQQLPATANSRFRVINRLALSGDGRVLLAATATGLYRSVRSDRTDWTAVHLAPASEVADVHFAPNDDSKAVAGSRNAGTVYYSRDSGATWVTATSDTGWGDARVELTYARANPSIVYASVDRNSGELWRSIDGGRTFHPRANQWANGEGTAGYLSDQGWYANAIWAGDPTDANVVMVGGLNVWRSRDGGASLDKISDWGTFAANGRSIHADIHVIVSASTEAAQAQALFVGCDGGLFRTNDLATVGDDPAYMTGWDNWNRGYVATQFYSGAGNAKRRIIVGGAQDDGTIRRSGGAALPTKPAAQTVGGTGDPWTVIYGGDGGAVAVDPTDSDYIYGEYITLRIFRGRFNGDSMDQIDGEYYLSNSTNTFWRPTPHSIPDAATASANFIAPFVLDPNNPNRILAGGQRLWRTNNARAPMPADVRDTGGGPSWYMMKDSLPSSNTTNPAFIAAIAIAPGDPDLVYICYNSGEIYRTNDATQPTPTWTHRPIGLPPHRVCTHITIDPGNHDEVYVTYGGFQAPNILLTTDGGTTWNWTGTRLPPVPVWTLTLHPGASTVAYAGTEAGIYRSRDAGKTWSSANDLGPLAVPVRDLFWVGDTLIAATHGRGMLRIPRPAALELVALGASH